VPCLESSIVSVQNYSAQRVDKQGSKWCSLDNEKYTLENNPQFIFTIGPHNDDFEVRVLIEKHIEEFDATDSTTAVAAATTATTVKKNRISYKLFNYDGHRISYANNH